MPTKFSPSFLYDFYVCNTLAPAVMAAEIVQYYIPQLIQLHNYTSASSSSQKKENWLLLNRYTQVTTARRLCMVSGAVANLTSPGKPRPLNLGFFCYLMRSVYQFLSFILVPQVTDSVSFLFHRNCLHFILCFLYFTLLFFFYIYKFALELKLTLY